MYRSFLFRTFFWVVTLAAVLVVIIIAMRAGSADAAIGGTRPQTLFNQFVVAGGPIVWFVLLPMSLIMVYLAADYGLTIRRKKLLPNGAGGRIVEIIRQFGIGQLEEEITDRSDFISVAVGKAAANGRSDWFRMRSVIAESLQDQAWGLLRRIEWINLIGSVSPMVGLFGTVVGMIKLFNTIVIAGGQPHPAQLADGISVALVTTFWGLFIAIPAMAVYGVFQNRIETLVSEAVEQAENIMPDIELILKAPQPPTAAFVGQSGRLKQDRAIREPAGKSTEAAGKSLSP